MSFLSSIVHTKREQSHDSNHGSFEFAWKLKIAFDPKMETIFPTLNVIDFEWGKDLPEASRAEIMNLIYSLVDADAVYSENSQKNFKQVPVARDLIEIVRGEGFEVQHLGRDGVYRTSKNVDVRKNLRDFFVSLSSAVDDETPADSVSKKFRKFVPDQVPTGKMTLEESIHEFLDSNVILSTSNTIKVCRCLRGEVVAPGYRTLRRIFPQNIPVNTMVGSWQVRIIVSSTGDRIHVQHSRRGKYLALSQCQPRYFLTHHRSLFNRTGKRRAGRI